MEDFDQQLIVYGLNASVVAAWNSLGLSQDSGLRLGRVTADFGTTRTVALPAIQTAELSGALAHYTEPQGQPKVGDWVAVRLFDSQRAVIEQVVPRHGEIARRAAGTKVTRQVMAANVDVAFVLIALDSPFNAERLKRYVYQLSINAIQTVVVLNKADKTNDVAQYVNRLKSFSLPIVITNAITGAGTDEILSFIRPGQTAMLLGSSGAGKSTLTNRLLGKDVQATQSVRQSDLMGRHTTVHRELFMLPHGGLLIDTPGVRELQLWGTEADLDDNYDDIAQLIGRCKFSNCRHGSEDGCAVQIAIRDGLLHAQRYAEYRRLKAELVTLGTKQSEIFDRHNKKSSRAMRRQDDDRLRDMND